MTKEKKTKKAKSVASQAVVTVTEAGDKLVHLPDGVFVPGEGRADGDVVEPDETEVLVEFSEYAKVRRDLEFKAGERRHISKHLADSLHKVCKIVEE